MACEDYERAVVEYIDGELPPRDVKGLKAHIERCQSCQEFYRDLKRMEESLEGQYLLYPGQDFTAKVMDKIRRYNRTREILTSMALFLVLSISHIALFPQKVVNFIFGTQDILAFIGNLATSLKEIYIAGGVLVQLIAHICSIAGALLLSLFNAMPWISIFFMVVIFAHLYLLSRYLAPRV